MQNWTVCILIVFCFVLNSTATSSVILLTILFILLFSNMSIGRDLFNIKFLLFISFGISLIIALVTKIDINQLIRLLCLIILFWTYPVKYDLQKKHIWILVFVGFYLIGMQIGKTLGIPMLNDFVNSNYPIEKNYWGDNEFDNVGEIFAGFSNRLGGIYYNPNIMGQSILILYVVIIIGLLKYFSKAFTLSIGALFFLSILLTGGRTAMLTFIFLNAFLFWPEIKMRFVFWIPFFLLLASVTIYYGTLFEFRAFYNLTGSFSDSEDSGGQKIQIFMSYLNEYDFKSIEKVFMFLLGNLNWDRQFDAELGYLLSFFGLIGTWFILLFFILVYGKTPPGYRFVFLLFLISITGTILINYRFSILMFMILSLVRNEENVKKRSLAKT
jgi:hypothetical protein